LAEEIESYAERSGSVFMASHSPQLVNALPFESVYFCKKNAVNMTEIHRLCDNTLLLNLYKEGELAGNMMRSGLLDNVYRN
jgi:predicted ATPase